LDYSIVPALYSSAPFVYDLDLGWSMSGNLIDIPALVAVGAMGLLVALGIEAAARFNNVMVVVKLAVVALFILCGIFFIEAENLTPFVPANTGNFGQYGFSGILRGAGVVFFLPSLDSMLFLLLLRKLKILKKTCQRVCLAPWGSVL
jgi:APA family basic amino acid/polyamine antiporter